MLNTFWWLITVEAIGLVAFLMAFSLFSGLKDRGYCVSKPLGILLIGYASWLLSVLHILPSTRIVIVGLLLVLGAAAAWAAWRRRRELREFVARERVTIVATEAIFLAFFIGWTLYRAYDPEISHTEQPMDHALLNASIRSEVGTPQDPWLAGYSVSYYYFGYWMMGVVSELTGVASYISFNLALALIPALAAAGIFGIVVNMVRADRGRWKPALIAGLAAVILLGIVSNLEGVLEFMRANALGSQAFWDRVRIDGLDGTAPAATGSWLPQDFWWWFRSTRVINTFVDGQGIDYTIQEFPFFSFMLGDLHPHVMSVPFGILFLALAWNFFSSPMPIWKRSDSRGLVSILVLGLALGGLAATNMWDLPTFAAMFLGVAALKAYQEIGGNAWMLLKRVIPLGVAVIGLAFLLFLPFFLGFSSSATGIAPVVAATTRPLHLLIVWALFLVAVVPFIIGSFWQTKARSNWLRLAIVGLIIGLLPYIVWAFLRLQEGSTTAELGGRFIHVLPFILLIAAAAYAALWLAKVEGASGKVWALVLSALGLLLIMGPELLFVRDSFGSRMNTVFKLYYQAWLVLAAASGFALYYWSSLRELLSGWRRWLTLLWAGVFMVLLAGSLYYPPAAAATKAEVQGRRATLDGLAYVAQSRSAEYEAIKILRQSAGPDAVIVEAVGEWADAGLISRSTGIPAVLNWPGHELQWRGSSEQFNGRAEDIARIYQTQDVQEARNLLAKYDVEYVFVGPREVQTYGADGLGKFSVFMDEVFRQEDVAIYRVRN